MYYLKKKKQNNFLRIIFLKDDNAILYRKVYTKTCTLQIIYFNF